jgi:hypothetical protein
MHQNLINAVCQGVYNILNGTLPINMETKQKLLRFRTKLHALCSTEHSTDEKIKILNQTGGFLTALLPTIADSVIGIITSLIKKKIES